MPSVSDTINIYSVSYHRRQFGVGTDKQFILLTDDIILNMDRVQYCKYILSSLWVF